VQSVLEALRSPKAEATPTAEDKLRLVLVFYLSVPDHAISKEDVIELESALKAAGADVAAFEYVRRTREISKMTVSLGGTATPVMGGTAGQAGGELFKGFSALGNRVFSCSLVWKEIIDIRFILFIVDGSFKRGWPRESDFWC
jgi:sec1 family domain-containing protein 1